MRNRSNGATPTSRTTTTISPDAEVPAPPHMAKMMREMFARANQDIADTATELAHALGLDITRYQYDLQRGVFHVPPPVAAVDPAP